MKTKKYAIGTYFPDGTRKTKRVYNRKKLYNKTYKSKPTKRRIKESLNQGKSIFKAVLAIILIIIAYNIVINGAVADNEATSFVDPQLAGEVKSSPARTVEQQIRDIAREWGYNENKAIRIAKCENSQYDPNFCNTQWTSSGYACGIFQFTSGTWMDGIRWRGLDWTLQDRYNPKKNIDMAMYFMAKRRELWRWNASKRCWHK